jgi:flagellar P-ring protein precursor FlgI
MAIKRLLDGIAWSGLLVALCVAVSPALAAPTETRIGDLTIRQGDIPRRLVGYGLVVGLDGTGDRSFGGVSIGSPTVRSVINLLRRFQIEVPSEHLHLRNVAAVLVTAEASPYLRAGGRFEVNVSALADATSLRGGVLWITPLLEDPDRPPVGTAQGPLYVAPEDGDGGRYARRGNSGRIAQGGILEVDPSPSAKIEPRLLLREPDLGKASRIAAAINAAMGDGTARIEDPGAVALTPPSDQTHAISEFLAVVDTLKVLIEGPSRIVISSRTGTVVAGGDVRVGSAVVSHEGITLQIGGTAGAEGEGVAGIVRMEPEALVQDVAAGLRAMGAGPSDVAAVFEALKAAGALNAEVVIR